MSIFRKNNNMDDNSAVQRKKRKIPDTIKSTRLAGIPGITYPEALPITSRKDHIVQAIKRHRVVVITGETGSGKTTQIPKMCLEAGRGISGIIGCTQPRRVAAITVAHRIAEELGEEIGRSVGYQIRFEDRTGRRNYIKIMTDGILLNEAHQDPFLRRYDTIIVDEAHERSLNIDFVLGFLRTLLNKRKDLKVIITSATLDTEKFSRAFHAPIIEVSGRMYPVEVLYQPLDPDLEDSGEITHIDAAVTALEKLMEKSYGGDVLIFMPTEQDIRDTCEIIEAKFPYDAAVLPLYARLPWTEQRRVFQDSAQRKIVVATNVAETSLTIPGIRYVIDTGLARISQYNPRSRTTSLPIREISRSSADQRKGRCGRVQKGICVRLFDKADYEDRPLYTEPEILRSNLAEVILRMLSLNLGDVLSFPFIDPPNPRNIRDGMEILKELGAIETRAHGTEPGDDRLYTLTEQGRIMARMPIDPRMSRMIIEAEKEGCVPDILIIASALSIQDPRERPAEKEAEADKIHTGFADPTSDFITLLHIWNRYHRVLHTKKSKNSLKKFCVQHYLSFRRMREWTDVHDQIRSILHEQGWTIGKRRAIDEKRLFEGIHKSILSGYLSHIATKKEKNIYSAAKGKEVMIFPGSGLFNKGGSWIVSAEMIETSRLFARMAANIHGEWLEELGGTLCRSVYSEPHWSRDRGEVVANEQVSLFGLVIVPQRRVSYGRINAEEASEIFIRSALVACDVKKPFPFLTHNQEVMEQVSRMEDKIRRRNLLAGEDELARFYRERLPALYDTRSLQKFIKDRGGDDFLRMKEEDILIRDPGMDELALYPDEVMINGRPFTCDYRYEPGNPRDGITLKVPIHMLSSLTAHCADWKIPGLLREKINTLLKGLPKTYRKTLPPLSHTTQIIMAEMRCGDGPLSSALSKFIHERFGVDIPASVWAPDTLADYLNVHFSIVDAQDRELASGRNINLLQTELVAAAESRAFHSARLSWEKTGVTTWNFGDLPDAITLESEGCFEGYAYPALEAAEESVNLRLFKKKQDANIAHREGVAALYVIHFRDEMKYLKKAIVLSGDMKRWADGFAGARVLESNMCKRLTRDLFAKNIRTQSEFIGHAEMIARQILPAGQDIVKKSKPLLRACYEAASALTYLENKNRFNTPELHFLKALREDLDALVPHNFMLLYDDERLSHVIRYLRALVIRAERGLLHLGKALRNSEEVKYFSDTLRDMRENLPSDASEEKKKAIEEFRWMIEEYKISVFAQELKTSFPISRKRLEKKIQEIERIV
jgi:ATP-dependent helicase HrpA